MPTMTEKPGAPSVASSSIVLPPDFPRMPGEVSKRFPTIEAYEANVQQWYRKLKVRFNDLAQIQSDAIGSDEGGDDSELRLQVGDLTVEVDVLSQAVIDANQAFARRLVTVSALTGTSSNITVSPTAPGSPSLNDLWVDTTSLITPITYRWNGSAWVEVTTPISAAAVAAEQSARITADGNLSGKYALTVVAGNVVTGMEITSSSGPGTLISSVIFRAADFKIYNGITGVTMFNVSGSNVQLAQTLNVSTAGKVFIGVGNYANMDTPWYVDSAGKFSLGSGLTWDGTTLSISGGSISTVDWNTQVTGRPAYLTDGRIPAAVDAAGLVISGVRPGINVTTGGAGLYLGADFMGYYSGAAWATYMDNLGRFYLGGTSGALQWNGTTLSITGNINVTSISGLNYAGSGSPGGAANNIVGQGSLATLSAVNYTTQVTFAPTNSAGQLIQTTVPGGNGLYLGSDHLGFYAAGAWRTFMDSSGNFYLGGTSGALQWNGTTLTITGNINVQSITGLNYAGSSSPGGAANNIVGQGSLATLSAVNYTTQVTFAPTNSAGQLIQATTPSGTGLYLGNDHLGFYNAGAWRTFMDSSGNFYLGGTSGALQWNGTTLTITGNINVTSISGLNYAGSSSPGGAANNIVGQGSLATLSAVNYNTQVSFAPTNSAGQLIQATTPSGTGLFLGNDHLGYYSSGAWRTFMDSSGNFYLGGTSGSLQWNGSTLTINGNGTFSGSLSAASGTFTGTLSAGTISGSTVVTGSVDVGTSGNVRGGQSAYNTGTGFWLGYSGGAHRFSIGNGSNERIAWDGSSLTIASDSITVGNMTLALGAFSYELNIGTAVSLGVTPSLAFLQLSNGSGGVVYLGNSMIYGSAGGATLRFETTSSLALDLSTDGALVLGGLDVRNSGGSFRFSSSLQSAGGDFIGDGRVRRGTNNGWTLSLFDGTTDIEFTIAGGQIYARYNGATVIGPL